MFKVIAGLIALVGVSFTTPAFAQAVYLDGSGVSVGIGNRGYDRGYNYDRPRHYRSHRGYDAYASDRCTTTRIVRSNGSVKTIRTCR